MDDRVVVKPLESEERTPGGIVLPDTAKEKPQKGTIEAVGPGKLLKDGRRVDTVLKIGDVVLFGKYSGHEVKIDGVEYKIMKEDDVLARIEN
jgi:chaperonin GroES